MRNGGTVSVGRKGEARLHVITYFRRVGATGASGARGTDDLY